MIATRPDILQVVCMVAYFQASPKETHVLAVKRIFQYLKGTIDYDLWYPKGEFFTLITYLYAKWKSCLDDRKSTNGGTFYLGDNLVEWNSKKQESISISIVEAKYIATIMCYTKVLWMNKMVKDLGIHFTFYSNVI